jgi:predicted NAD-dependent protein-ADP-ribosyltransferase YbiA (DUF1768 family)
MIKDVQLKMARLGKRSPTASSQQDAVWMAQRTHLNRQLATHQLKLASLLAPSSSSQAKTSDTEKPAASTPIAIDGDGDDDSSSNVPKTTPASIKRLLSPGDTVRVAHFGLSYQNGLAVLCNDWPLVSHEAMQCAIQAYNPSSEEKAGELPASATAPLRIDQHEFLSVTHYMMAMRFADTPEHFAQVQQATSHEAAHAISSLLESTTSRAVADMAWMQPEMQQRHLRIALIHKFREPYAALALASTAGRELRFIGIGGGASSTMEWNRNHPSDPKRNRLGRLVMDVRDSMPKQQSSHHQPPSSLARRKPERLFDDESD